MDEIILENLTLKAHNSLVFENLSYTIRFAEKVAVFGTGDSGKTCLLLTIAGMLKPTSGKVSFGGNLPLGINPVRAAIGVGSIEKVTPLFGEQTVAENLEFYRRFSGAEISRAGIETFAESWGIAGIIDQPLSDISSYDKALLSCAIAFLGDPRIIILDEPTSNLTDSEGTRLWKAIDSHLKGKTLIFSTLKESEASLHARQMITLSAFGGVSA